MSERSCLQGREDTFVVFGKEGGKGSIGQGTEKKPACKSRKASADAVGDETEREKISVQDMEQPVPVCKKELCKPVCLQAEE